MMFARSQVSVDKCSHKAAPNVVDSQSNRSRFIQDEAQRRPGVEWIGIIRLQDITRRYQQPFIGDRTRIVELVGTDIRIVLIAFIVIEISGYSEIDESRALADADAGLQQVQVGETQIRIAGDGVLIPWRIVRSVLKLGQGIVIDSRSTTADSGHIAIVTDRVGIDRYEIVIAFRHGLGRQDIQSAVNIVAATDPFVQQEVVFGDQIGRFSVDSQAVGIRAAGIDSPHVQGVVIDLIIDPFA